MFLEEGLPKILQYSRISPSDCHEQHPGAIVEIFEELRGVAVRQSEEADFPLWLLPQVLEIADNPELYAEEYGTVELLLSQLKEFDTFAGAGCFDSSVSAETISRTLRLILGR